jgi:hypothetical protein
MALINPPFGESSGGAKILKFGAARLAIGIVAWAPNGRNDEIAGLETGHIGAHFFNNSEGFVADHKIFESRRRRTVNEGADFLVGAANADFEGTDFYFVIAGNGGGNVFDQLDFFASLENTYSSHR